MITFQHVSKQYSRDTSALSDITVDIKDGEFVFLIGPSGAGKSTLLRLILRDVLPTEGTIAIDEWNVESLPQSQVHILRRQVGMVFQDFKLLTDRTIFENVALGLEVLGKHDEEIEKGVRDVLSLVGLSNKADQFPQQLSAGELQRASIARAIVAGPKILLADEPTGNLDPDTAWDIIEILQEINKLGTTVIIATHNAAFVNQIKKRTIALKEGKIISDEEKGRYHTKSHEKHHHDDKGDKS